MKPMPWWKRWPNRVRLALTGLKYRLARLLHRVGLLPSERRASTDTMGDWKRLQALADDPQPRLVRPPDGPYADLIRRVRLYAQNGAKALAPLLDSSAPPLRHVEGDGRTTNSDDAWCQRYEAALGRATDHEAVAILGRLFVLGAMDLDALRAIHAAYNSPWTVVDGEVFEVVTEKAKPEGVVP